MSTSYALDRLDRPEISSGRVRSALDTWIRTAHMSSARLRQPYNDWTSYIAPDARDTLEAAFNARPGEPWWRKPVAELTDERRPPRQQRAPLSYVRPVRGRAGGPA